eukprot:TRINITY_DN4676_c0_g1_i1.p1 TRINITY_DN4676_c0_g1~~TRINITY_DN4676_c0_g1_i1.p1  ORF type:complete len:373 (+),score=148.69 TRINITY_DN4676_c0_g1_i1:56-1174(+)
MSSKLPPIPCSGWCYTEAEDDIVYDYAWTIERFSRAAANYRTGKTMYSDQFTVVVNGKQTRWRLKMYPNGRKNVDQGYVTLFLKDSGRDQPANLRANVKFSVVDSLGNKTNTKTIDKEYKVLNHAFGYSKFIKHQWLLSPERMLLPEDKLTLLCSITIAGKNIISSGAQRPAGPQADPAGRLTTNKLGGDLSRLLASPQDMFSDMKLLCGERRVELLCHTNILAARSPVFQAMFMHDTAEAQNKVVEMTDVEPEVAEEMLQYIYTGNTKTAGKEAELLAAADKYSLLELKESCEEVLCNETNIDTVLNMLVLADRHEASKLKDVCVKFLIENCHTVVRQPGWRELLEPYPALLAEMFEAVATTPPSKRRRIE